MRTVQIYWMLLIALFALCASAACHNDCNRKGHCSKWGTCECFKGYEGNDCSRKSCPTGPPLADIASETDVAHASVQCSNQGTCDFKTGNCICNTGYSGRSCQSTSCYNNCNGRGECVSLRSAALLNDGYLFNRTTKYEQWDADVIFGCKCDPGYSGADCSQRVCEYGPDPRLEVLPRETVTLVCDCREFEFCEGRFKLRFLGTVMRTWMYPTSRAYELADAIMAVPGIFANNSGHVVPPVQATNDSTESTLCRKHAITRTKINFRRNHGDLPSLSVYANLMIRGSVYFETTQQLLCDCQNHACNGTFRVSFDNEMSGKIKTWGNQGIDVTTALMSLKTIKAANITVTSASTGPICVPDVIANHTYVFKAQMGNIPRIGLWSSVAGQNMPEYYRTENTTNVLRIVTDDGRDDNVKLCNGIGSCDFSTGTCRCPFGWEFNGDLGPCAQLQVNTSRYAGLARCPGVAMRSSPLNDLSGSRNYQAIMYVSLNPTYTKYESPGTVANPPNVTRSGIYTFAWRPDTISGPDIDESTQALFLNLTSNSSAGPLVLDATKDRLFFVDQHLRRPFIGIAPLRGSPGAYTEWHLITYKIFGMASDAHFKRRTLYWSAPGIYEDNRGDGAIFYALMDENTPTVHSLAHLIGQSAVVEPHGLAIHYKQQRLYWTDRNHSDADGNRGVLRSCKLDGSDLQLTYVFAKVDNTTVSTNLTDLVIDFRHNNTAFILDNGQYPAVIAVSLDFPDNYNNDSETYDAWLGLYPTRTVTSTWQIKIGNPRYIFLDDTSNLVLWSDEEEQQIAFQRYIKEPFDLFSPGVAYVPNNDRQRTQLKEFFPVALVIDIGLGPPLWNDVIDCYGNGVCLGLEGNFECQCKRGYFGDCLSRTCPTGRAWFHEPAVDNVAHDVFTECSSMGVCDRRSGECSCRKGYEGAACERMSCPGRISTSSDCSGRGRCVSMRKLALTHKDEYNSPAPVVYGSKASDPVTWDADMIQGCTPDVYGSNNGEYFIKTPSGPALTKYECPEGYNVRLLDQVYRNVATDSLVSNYTNHREIQAIRCEAHSGFFRLSFRGATSRSIHANATSIEVVEALQYMSTVGKVEVTYDEGQEVLCSRQIDYRANVTFISQLGRVPLMTVAENALRGRPATVTVSHAQTGSPQALLECAGKGDCDFDSGMCRCWAHQGTSDGVGGPGDSGDCGNYIV